MKTLSTSLFASMLGVCALLVAGPAAAATLTVTTTDDEENADGDCSLREAVAAAEDDAAVDDCAAGAGADVVVLPAGAFSITTLDLASAVTLRGQGSAATRLTLGAAPITVAGVVVAFDGVTIAGGGAPAGGAIRALNSDVTLRRVVVSGHQNVGGADAAAVAMGFNGLDGTRPLLTVVETLFSGNTGAPAVSLVAGTVIVQKSTFANNAGDATGGAIVARGDGNDAVFVDNSTFSGNSTTGSGGALASFVPASISSSTFVLNRADVSGGALFFFANPDLFGSILAGNTAPVDANCSQAGAFAVSGGFNIVDDDEGCAFATAGDTVLAIPTQVVEPLADNGGFTPTHLPVGPAIDSGTCTNVAGPDDPRFDQRGAARVDGQCDRGAVERGGRFLQSLLDVDVEPAGANCARGGNRLSLGVDDGGASSPGAGNEVLDADEVDSVVFLCEQADAPVVIAVEDDGTCADGGIVVHSGVDDDGDGVLDVGERDRSDRLCNGADGSDGDDGDDGDDGEDGAEGPRGPPGADGQDGADGERGETGGNGGAGFSSLVRISTVAAGDDGCPAGGQKVEAGVDDGNGDAEPGDGTLDDDEVDSDAVVCNGEAFEDEFEATGGPTCASGAVPASWLSFGALLLLLGLRRRR